MANRVKSFYIDIQRLTDVCKKAYSAYENGSGIFRDKKRFLPEWNLPEELEHSPRRIETKSPELAANYLWLMALLEKRSQSRFNMKNGVRVYSQRDKKWIFDPNEVIIRPLEEVRDVMSREFRYTMAGFAENLVHNDGVLVREYGGNAMNVIDGRSYEEARERLVGFKGVGPGISNLFIIYLMNRKVASVTDSEETCLKIDIHKSRIPANTGAIVPVNKRVRRDLLVPVLERAYNEICRENGFNSSELDAALWIIGSEGCAKMNYKRCVSFCPLEEICQSCVREDDSTGELIIFDENGERVETRVGVNQFGFDF